MVITTQILEQAVDKAAIRYDRDGDQHYDVISAFIKSIRGSDVQAALHYLARMIAAGEDPRFIARRLVILASEDIGLADPTALTTAVAAADAVAFIGMPEGRINLAQAVIALALAPKSNAVIMAIDAAMADVDAGRIGLVPAHLRDAHYAGAKKIGHGKGYQYAHDHPHGIAAQQYLPDALVDARYYRPPIMVPRRGRRAADQDQRTPGPRPSSRSVVADQEHGPLTAAPSRPVITLAGAGSAATELDPLALAQLHVVEVRPGALDPDPLVGEHRKDQAGTIGIGIVRPRKKQPLRRTPVPSSRASMPPLVREESSVATTKSGAAWLVGAGVGVGGGVEAGLAVPVLVAAGAELGVGSGSPPEQATVVPARTRASPASHSRDIIPQVSSGRRMREHAIDSALPVRDAPGVSPTEEEPCRSTYCSSTTAAAQSCRHRCRR